MSVAHPSRRATSPSAPPRRARPLELASHDWDSAAPLAFPRLRTAVRTYTMTPTDPSRRIVIDGWLLNFSYDDVGRYRTHAMGRRWSARPARVAHLYPPGMPFWEDMPPPFARLSVYVIFDGPVPAALQHMIDPRFGQAIFEDREARLGRLLEEAALTGAARGNDGIWIAQSCLLKVVDLMLRATRTRGDAYVIPSQEDEAAAENLVLRAHRFLRVNLARPIALRDVARELNVSVSTLSHRFRADTGRTPMRALMEIRLDAAKGLLRGGEPLKTIAAQLGFSSAFHLSTAFKKAFGMSPKAFRNGTDGGS